jgi:hypothetical protein
MEWSAAVNLSLFLCQHLSSQSQSHTQSQRSNRDDLAPIADTSSQKSLVVSNVLAATEPPKYKGEIVEAMAGEVWAEDAVWTGKSAPYRLVDAL